MEQIKQYCDSAKATNKLIHDLRSPLISVKGFSDELHDAFNNLIDLIERHEETLPQEFRDGATELIEQDLIPCLKFIEASIRKANDQLDESVSKSQEAPDKP